MTIVVLSGPDAGKVLRTSRSQITVGSAKDNELVVRDADVAAHHFVITVDGSGWRADAVSERTQIVIDNRWSHPTAGRRGALIYATGTELLLYPGDLEQDVIERELRQRKTGEQVVPEDPPDATIRMAPVSRRAQDNLPQVATEEQPTITVGEGEPAPRVSSHRAVGIDAFALSSMPTIGDAPIQAVLTGQASLRGRDALGETPTEADGPPMPQVVTVDAARSRSSAWDRAPRARTAAPEILAEPESKMQAMPGSGSSVLARPDDASAWGAKSAVVVSSPDEAPGGSTARANASGAWGARGAAASAGGGSAWDARPSASPPAASTGSSWNAKPAAAAPVASTTGTGAGSSWNARPSAAAPAAPPAPPAAGSAWDARPSGGAAVPPVSGSAWDARAPSAPAVPPASGSAWDARAPSAPAPSPAPGSAWDARSSGPAAASSGARVARSNAPVHVPTNAWGSRASQPATRPAAPYTGRQLSLAELARHASEPGLQVLHDPDGEMATVTRLFVTRLLELQRAYGYRAFMLTSPEPLTGKTTTALNLAFALAEDSKRRIAFVEANFRTPRVAEVLGIPPDVGLLGILEGRLAITDASAKIADRNLLVFPTGGTHPSPAEALASPRFKTLVQELAASVDIAIIDAPSVKTAADANLILPLVDGALLVVLEQETRGVWVHQAIEQLGTERVLGAVYNRMDKLALKAIAPDRKERIAAVKTRG